MELKLEIKDELIKEVGKLQDDYHRLIYERRLTKKVMCDLVRPFRDKYGFTDLQSLMIARNEMSISEIANLLCKKD